MKRFSFHFLSLIISLAVISTVTPLFADNTVVVEGVASTRDGALDRALRDAVRQGAGVDIDSISTLVATEEDESFREQTVSATTGSVQSYRILAASLNNGMWRVKVEASVSKKQAVKPTDVSVTDAKVIVVGRTIFEGPDSIDVGGNDLKEALEGELVDRHFDVRFAMFDKEKVFNPALDLPEMGIDPLQTDIIIFAEQVSKFRDKKDYYGIERYRVKTTIELKAIRPDSLKIVASKRFEAEVTGRTMEKATEGSVERATEKMSVDFVDQLVRQLVWERNNGRIFSIYLEGKNLGSDQMLTFISRVGTLPGMMKVLPRHRTNDKTLIDCLSYLGRSALMQTLFPVLNELNLEISGFQANSVVLAPYRGVNGRLWVDSIPQGADVYIDMALAGTTPILKELTPGSHNVRFSCLGFYDTKATIEAVRGKVVRVMGELEVENMEQKTGLVNLVTIPEGATIRNDKQQVIGDTPLYNLTLDIGTHPLTFSKEGFITKTEIVTVGPDKAADYKIELIKMTDLVAQFQNSYRTGTSKGMLAAAAKKKAEEDYEGAATILIKVLKNDKDCMDAAYLLGEIYENNLEKFSSANLYYSRYFRMLSSVPVEDQQRGDYKTQMELVEEAIARVEEKIQKRMEELDKAQK
jgi:hypothetical protein